MILVRKKKIQNISKLNGKVRKKYKFKNFDILYLLETFYCIVGPQRIGKTSLNRAFMNTLYKKYNKQFIRESRIHVSELNRNGYKLDLNVKHLFYSNHRSNLDKHNCCHDVEFSDLVLPYGSDYSGIYFPFRSFIEFQEIDRECDNREWRNFDLAHKDFFKFYGHNGLTIGCDTQDYGNCDSKLRGLFTHLIFVYHREVIKRWWHIKPRFVWYFYVKNNQLANAMKDLNQFANVEIPVVERYKFVYKGNIHEMYDSLSSEPLFLNGIKNYKFRKCVPLDLSPKGVKRYCEKYSKKNGK